MQNLRSLSYRACRAMRSRGELAAVRAPHVRYRTDGCLESTDPVFDRSASW